MIQRLQGRRGRVFVTAGLLVLILTSCADQSDALHSDAPNLPWGSAQLKELAQFETDQGNLEQAEALSDGVVTFEEYDAAFERVARCLEGYGISVSAPVMSPVSNNSYEFTMEIGALEHSVGIRLADECEMRFWTSVSKGYTFSTPDVMDPAVRLATATCLRSFGVILSGDEVNVKAFMSLPEVDPEVFDECLTEAVMKLYPEISSIAYGY